MTSATTLTAPDGFVIEVQPAESSDAWLTAAAVAAVIAALIAAVATIWVGLLNRKTGKEARDNAKDANTNSAEAAQAAKDGAKAAGQSAQAATTSADSSKIASAAADKAAEAASKAATTAERAAAQLDTWRQREETMRLLRSGAEMAAKAATDSTASLVGLAMLETLREAHNLVQAVDKDFIERVIGAVTLAVIASKTDDDEPKLPGAYL